MTLREFDKSNNLDHYAYILREKGKEIFLITVNVADDVQTYCKAVSQAHSIAKSNPLEVSEIKSGKDGIVYVFVKAKEE